MTALLQSPTSPPLSCSRSDALRTLFSPGGEARRREVGSPLDLLVAAVKRSLAQCRAAEGEAAAMEIGWPTDVRHVAHVTFDRFHGFLGLPVELEPEVPRRAPSASATVFGVSTESMQCSYDTRGNSVPTILLQMQRRLYERGGLQAEGIFRINAENSQEEYVRDQLNSGIVPDAIDVHCLAGLIKAWFRELPTGVLDPLTPDQVMQCQSEEDCAQVVSLLPPTEAALLDWAINLMADVVLEEQRNKMNARNIAMVFAPNMSQNADPLTALMYVVQVMNFLKMLIVRTLKARQESILNDTSISQSDPSDENGEHSTQLPLVAGTEEAVEQPFVTEDPILDDVVNLDEEKTETDEETPESSQSSLPNVISEEKKPCVEERLSQTPPQTDSSTSREEVNCSAKIEANVIKAGKGKARKARGPSPLRTNLQAEKLKASSVITRIDSKAERTEAWR